ncbi:uroporphyrinogen decarboxylase [Salisaeta longa]|uniref:uroporphyrinogen decarboxylase n=1 Tax=Salisaeta longa TaxID=503170 RepID=UPI0003B70A50|nr:uroporphyrinogen decarboxylase [Salisaeta longa]
MPSFPPLQNDLILRAARGAPTARTPVWMMRQAGRYLPEYQAVRAKHSFFEVVGTPELAAEVTLQPIERFPLDAAIIFSDILVIPQALGLTVEMVPGKGPHFPEPLDGPAALDRLVTPDLDAALGHVFEALTLTRHRLDGRVPLIGFAGAPWTLMAYMIEGGGSKTYKQARAWLYRHPDAAHALLERLATLIGDYLVRQIDAGAQLVQVFDSWAGLLGPSTFQTFGLPYLTAIAERVKAAHPDTPAIVFAKGAPYALDALADTPYDVISLDWTMDPAAARQTVGARAVLQGNLDPCALYAAPADIRRHVHDMLAGFGPQPHIANLGHGMHPTHDPEHARAFIEAVHDVSEQMHGG